MSPNHAEQMKKYLELKDSDSDAAEQVIDGSNMSPRHVAFKLVRFPWLPKEKTALRRSFLLVTVDYNDTVSYGCIRVALELQPSVRKMQPS